MRAAQSGLLYAGAPLSPRSVFSTNSRGMGILPIDFIPMPILFSVTVTRRTNLPSSGTVTSSPKCKAWNGCRKSQKKIFH